MARKVYVSRHGLMTCPECGKHARVERDAVRDAGCPFCGTALVARSEGGALHRAAAAGRSGLLAASLFGVAALGPVTGCSTDDPDPGDVSSDTNADTTPTPAYGIPADTAEPDTTEPADTAEDVEIEDAADSSFEPEYGIPADTTEDDVEVEDAADGGAEPDYGLPPDAAP